eukprot:1143089-Pelagomonas_calceolata.AAC.12
MQWGLYLPYKMATVRASSKKIKMKRPSPSKPYPVEDGHCVEVGEDSSHGAKPQHSCEHDIGHPVMAPQHLEPCAADIACVQAQTHAAIAVCLPA